MTLQYLKWVYVFVTGTYWNLIQQNCFSGFFSIKVVTLLCLCLQGYHDYVSKLCVPFSGWRYLKIKEQSAKTLRFFVHYFLVKFICFSELTHLFFSCRTLLWGKILFDFASRPICRYNWSIWYVKFWSWSIFYPSGLIQPVCFPPKKLTQNYNNGQWIYYVESSNAKNLKTVATKRDL